MTTREIIRRDDGAPVFGGFAKVRISKNVTRTIRITKRFTIKGVPSIAGMRVDDKTGEDWSKDTKTTTTEEMVIARESDIIRHLALNSKYGLLERA
jgi:hypothetical protein